MTALSQDFFVGTSPGTLYLAQAGPAFNTIGFAGPAVSTIPTDGSAIFRQLQREQRFHGVAKAGYAALTFPTT